MIGDGPEFSEATLEMTSTELFSSAGQGDEIGRKRDTVFDKINKYGSNFSMWAIELEDEISKKTVQQAKEQEN